MSEGGKRKLTNAQRKALDWLPADGGWRVKPGRLSAALSSLYLAHSGTVQCEWGDFGPKGGREQRWRLTAAGLALFAENQHDR